jgi:dTDP-4-amino-4,6-dideoxygalactose transaminase
MIPFVDLKIQYQNIKSEIDQAIQEVIENTAFVGGNYASKFEKEFAEFIGVAHCIACANGTDSLEILLQAMGIGEGDEVLVPAISWISTSEAVSSLKATPVFVDVDAAHYTINLDLIEEKITSKTKAIIPVHLYGQPVDMIRLMDIAERHNLKVLEDCAQAHGAEFEGQKIGTFGHCASFSFYPGKNLGAYGDSGGMVTNDPTIARVARMIANHGQEGKHNHLMEGRNSRMDGIQAAILSAKLKHLSSWTDKRIANASLYDQLFGTTNVILPKVINGGKHVFHLYVIRVNHRDQLMEELKKLGIGVSIHYPKALPFLECYEAQNHQAEDFPVAHKVTNEILSLPMYAELTNEQIAYVVDSINTIVE